MNRIQTWLHVTRWNLWRWTDRNEKAWMRSMDRIAELDKRVTALERKTA